MDRKDHRDLSVFQIGFRLVERRPTSALPILIPLCPVYGCKLLGNDSGVGSAFRIVGNLLVPDARVYISIDHVSCQIG